MKLSAAPFYALIMAAMRNADTTNQEKLEAAWPEVWQELKQRYNAPGGCLTDSEMEWLMRVMNPQEDEEDTE